MNEDLHYTPSFRRIKQNSGVFLEASITKAILEGGAFYLLICSLCLLL